MLEDALADRSGEVRQVAATLLAALPASRLAQRMIERVTALLAWTPAKLLQAAHVEITLPAVLDPAMERDGMSATPPTRTSKGGQRAWLLTQMLAVVPPPHWCQHWNATPRDIMRATDGNEWRTALLEGWAMATERHRDADWDEALLASPVATTHQQQLLGVLPAPRWEAHIRGLLKAERGPLIYEHPAWAPLQASPHAWSEAFARDVLAQVRRALRQGRQDWQMRHWLSAIAGHVPPTLLEEALHGWPTDLAPAAQETLESLLTIVQFRRHILATLIQRQPNQ